MATIINPTPVQTSTFGGFWIQSLNVALPNGDFKGRILARLLPYDGTHILATGAKDVRIFDLTTPAPAAAALIAALKTELTRLSGQDVAGLRTVSINAPDPAKPVAATGIYADQRPFVVKDCFAKAGEDATFATALNTVLGSVAALAGLSVV